MNFLLKVAPKDSQLSSKRVIFFEPIKLCIFVKSFEFPKRFTAKITFVFSEIASSRALKLKLRVCKSNELEKKYNILETFESIDKLLLHEKDFSKYQKIIVCTSEKRFLNLAKVLTNYECEVLFEKPLGLSFEESLKIIELSNDKFFLALNRRFYDGINELRNLISNKKLIHGLLISSPSMTGRTED